MEDFNVEIGAIYIHRKGGCYRVIDIATHTESEEKLVVHRSLYDDRVWARPYEMFTDGRFKKAEVQ